MTLKKVISGGQSGVDQAALRAAALRGIATGGTAAEGWLAEDPTTGVHGPTLWLADYGLVEGVGLGYRERTRANVRDADATVVINYGVKLSPGSLCALTACNVYDKPRKPVVIVGEWEPIIAAAELARWLEGYEVLNVGGNRESVAEGIGEWAEEYLGEVFDLLARP